MAFVYPKISHDASTYPSGTASFLFDLVAWLVDDETAGGTAAWTTGQGGTGGPGWTVIEAFGRSMGGNNVRGKPLTLTGNGTMASFPTGSGINTVPPGNPDTITSPWSGTTMFLIGDWIVLQSVGTNPFQLYIEYASTTNLEFKLIPLAAKGGADDFTLAVIDTDVTAPPPAADFPATSVPSGATTTFRSIATFSTIADYSGVSDDRMVAFLVDDSSDPSFIYVGDVDNAAPSDVYPYVLRQNTATTHWDYEITSTWDRCSPIDEITLLTAGCLASMFSQGSGIGNYLHAIGSTGLGGEDNLLPVGVYFHDLGHRHTAGFLKNVFSISDNSGFSGTLNDPQALGTGDNVGPNSPGIRNFIWRNDASTSPGISLSWDGKTIFP